MAVSDVVSIYNLALNAVGERSNVSSPNETNRRTEVCGLWYEILRDQILEAARWPEATKYRRLALSSKREEAEWAQGDPAPGYSHAYVLPADCLRPQYITGWQPFELTDGILHCNVEEPILKYTFRQEEVLRWSHNLKMAVAYGLAGHIAQPLSGKTSLMATLVQRANDIILAARVNSANQNQQTYETLPEWIEARGYNNQNRTQFFFPHGSLLNVS